MWAELKSDEHLLRLPTKTVHLMPFHLPSAVLNHDRDLFIAGTAPSFSIKRMCKSSVELDLVYKNGSSTKHLRNSNCCPGKTNYIHCSRNGGLFLGS